MDNLDLVGYLKPIVDDPDDSLSLPSGKHDGELHKSRTVFFNPELTNWYFS